MNNPHLIGHLKKINSLLPINWIDCSEDEIARQFQAIKDIIHEAKIEVFDIGKNLLQCPCIGKKLYCYMSSIALECAKYAKALGDDGNVANTKTSDLSLNNQQDLRNLLDFIVSYGLMQNMDSHVGSFFPISCENFHGSKKDLYFCCRYMVQFCNNCNLRKYLIPKHLLPFLLSLMQLVYIPKSLQPLTPDNISFCKKSLITLISNWSPLTDLVKSLLIIQGSTTRKSPKWLQKACGFLLSRCLLQDGGVNAVIQSLLSTIGNDTSSWKKVEIASQILSTHPQITTQENYYSIVCTQILNLFKTSLFDQSNLESEKLLLQTLSATVLSLYEKSEELTNQCFFNILFHPLNRLYSTNFNTKISKDFDDLFSISQIIDILHKIFVLFKHPNIDSTIKQVVFPHLQGLFVLLVWSSNSIWCIRSHLQELVVKCLNTLDSENASLVLLCMCGIVSESGTSPLRTKHLVKSGLDFRWKENGDIIISDIDVFSRSPEDVIADQNHKVQCIIKLIKSTTLNGLSAQVLISLLKHIKSISHNQKATAQTNHILNNDERTSLHLQSGEVQLIAYALLISLCEDCEPKELFKDIGEITSFIEVLLTRACVSTKDLEHSRLNTESMKLSFAILGMCLVNPLSKDHQRTMGKLIPVLQKLSLAQHLSKHDRETASDLAIVITTQGVGSEIDFESFSKSLQEGLLRLENQHQSTNAGIHNTDTSSSKQKISKVVPIIDQNVNDSTSIDKPSKLQSQLRSDNAELIDERNEVFSVLNSIDDAASSLFDPCPSLRAAGFRYLTQSIKAGAINEGQSIKLRDLFLEILFKEEDSFVYLSAIQAIVELIDYAPIAGENASSLFHHLLDAYNCNIQTQDEIAQVKAVKLGEILVRLVRKLGDLANFQSEKLIPVLFRGCRDKRAQVRSSCLSNLADLCPLIRYKLASFRYELKECVFAAAISDEDVNARRAAVLVLRNLIDALQEDFLQIFDDISKEFYHILKQCYQDDSDCATQLHSQLALESLDKLMREVLFSKNKSFHKKIIVLP